MLDHRSLILSAQDLTVDAWPELMGRAGLTSLMLHAVRLPHDINELIWLRHSDLGRRLAARCADRGIRLEYQVHTGSWLLPRILYHQQPELFRMDAEGRRTCDVNWCLSSEAAWELVEARVVELARGLPPETHRYLWFLDDVRDGACLCPQCRELSPSDQGLLFANRVLQVLRRVDPVAQVCFLAYHSTLASPTQVAPADGVFLEFAPIARDYTRPVDDPEIGANRDTLARLRELVACFAGHPLHVTEYWLDTSRHSGWKRPFVRIPVSMDVVRRDVAVYRALGVTSITSYAVGCDDEYWLAYGEPPVVDYGRILAGG